MISATITYDINIPEIDIPDVAGKVSRVLYYNVANTFATDTNPYGMPWRKHSPNYWRYANGKRLPKPYKLLVWSGDMFASIRPEVFNGNRSTVYGTDKKIPWHNNDRQFIPTNGLPTSWKSVVLETIREEAIRFYG